jgi:hypothetical protein
MLAITNKYALAKEVTLDTRDQKKDKESSHSNQLSHPVLRPKPDAHCMYAYDQVVIHTARM